MVVHGCIGLLQEHLGGQTYTDVILELEHGKLWMHW